MASSPKLVCIFLLLCSLKIYARDSQFFSKVTRNRDEITTTTPNTNNNHFINTKEDDFVHLNKQDEKPEEQPNFIPQTTETGYGLYGHETGLDPPSTTTTATTTTTLYNMDENNNNNNYENFNNYYKNKNENHEKNYVPELQGLSDTTIYTEKTPSRDWSYNTNGEGKYYENNFKNENFNNYNMNNNEKNYLPESKGVSYTDAYPSKGWSNNGEGKSYGGRYDGVEEKQGMSDTRFMENGKYFYDLNAEEKYDNPTNNNFMSYNTKYNSNGYYGNKETNYEEVYNNNNNNNVDNKYYNNRNGMQKFQSRFPEEEEFDFDQP